MSKPVMVYAPEVSEKSKRWGVYSIPKMWREWDGTLYARFNGEEDSGDLSNILPNLYFCSADDGKTWSLIENGEEKIDILLLAGINPPYLKLKTVI